MANNITAQLELISAHATALHYTVFLVVSLQLLLSLNTRGWGGKVTTALPPIIKAAYEDRNVTVRLQQGSISIRQPKSGRHN